MSASSYSERPPDHFLRFVLVALVLSVLLHGAFFFWAWRYEPPYFGEHYYEQIVPRKFRVEPVEIDPSAFDREENDPVAEPARGVVPVELPPERVVMENPVTPDAAPQKLDLTEITSAEPRTPSPSPATGFSAGLDSLPARDSSLLVAELESMRQQLLESEATSPARPTFSLPEEMTQGTGNPAASASGTGLRFGSLPGYSELDDLLGRTGPLEQGTAPIFMPGDLLFEYDEAELRDGAVEVLRKLGTLIQRNPATNFRIEGHTDAFGSPEYNQGLSERRALAVKMWLVEQMGIPAERIRTRGLGSTRLVAPATETIEGQKLNRRVEIVLESPAVGTPSAPTLP